MNRRSFFGMLAAPFAAALIPLKSKPDLRDGGFVVPPDIARRFLHTENHVFLGEPVTIRVDLRDYRALNLKGV